MPTKIFTTFITPCPFGKLVTIDSPGCRSCEHYYRNGTGTFFWCKAGSESVPNMTREILHPKPKRGRPRKTTIPGKAPKKPVKRRKKKNG